VVIPERVRWHGRLAARLIHGLISLLAASLRWELHDQAHLGGSTGPTQPGRVIFALWHNRLALSLPVFRRYVRRGDPARRLAALVSASRDGGLLARTLELFDAEPVRGSSSRRGAQAVRELVGAARRGCDLAITPDGPRGPRYQAQEGVIVAAQLTGLPIVPACMNLRWYRPLRSWDRFQIPLPFSRCEVRFGERLVVPRELSPEQREDLRRELERRLQALTRD
jgi:lysophospholipid acyltransferase (LPLAT)-like uncharacterized protein